MNTFKCISAAIFLVIALPLSVQAEESESLKKQIWQKKKTITTAITLAIPMAYLALKLADYRYKNKPLATSSNLTSLANQNRKNLEDKNSHRKLYYMLSFYVTGAIIYFAHSRNWFGENNPIEHKKVNEKKE